MREQEARWCLAPVGRFWGNFMPTSVEDASPVQVSAVRPVTLGWVLKRSIIGIAILLVAMGGLAWLTYASIDPDLDGEPSPATAQSHDKPVRLVPIDL